MKVVAPYDTPIGEPVRTLVMTERFNNERRAVAEKYVRETIVESQIGSEYFQD